MAHSPVLLLGGTDDPALLRSLSEIVQWLKLDATDSTNGSQPETTEEWAKTLETQGDKPGQLNYAARVELPQNTSNCRGYKHGLKKD